MGVFAKPGTKHLNNELTHHVMGAAFSTNAVTLAYVSRNETPATGGWEMSAMYFNIPSSAMAHAYAHASHRAGETTAKVATFARDVAVSFPLLHDPGAAVQAAYGAGPGLPVTLLIDAKGVVRQRLNASTTGGALRGRVQGLLGQAVR